ncbi:hypothetical protein ONS95_009445 [Cadophora gregata]|uniref:uncharacterized protein n=1 Tax=Cadophora gregata TaxID=51156 RepID=UPI0026DB20BE|nr:uncharacterized protein ONS95_009445 [Cadophora gregata]KAK0124495.1 hypothetical protein ONS95_009445 [Cadophora gregata]KAK0129652.1 hypothetical protein ONS96_000216 [Cadophora gregata f. sp. sojae]
MARFKAIVGLFLLLMIFGFGRVEGYDGKTCCNLAKSEGAFVGLVPDNQTCGQTYLPGLPPAEPLYISYQFCKTRCSGIQLSNATIANEWIAPIAQFIMPLIIFSMSIPRRKEIEFANLFEFQWPRNLTRFAWFNNFVLLFVSSLCFTVILIPVTIDTIIWIAVIIVGAGNMLVGGLYEAHLDYRIVNFVRDLGHGSDEGKLRMKRELLVTVTCGNLLLDKGNPQESIPKSITIPGLDTTEGDQSSRFRLLNLLGSQASFGGTVGSPVLFYLAPFIYTILDLLENPSDEDSAISLSFGIELMIIVHVAIISGCLLASNNPNTAAGIVGTDRGCGYRQQCLRPSHSFHIRGTPQDRWTWDRFSHSILGWSNTYETEFQPVSLWSRGTNKMKWIKRTQAWNEDETFRKTMEFTWRGWILKVFIPALLLVIVPPLAGGTVAYMTPPRGVGCRALSIMIYGLCQVFSVVLALIRSALEDDDRGIFLQYLFTGWRYWALSSLCWFGSLVAAVGGMLLQIVGIFRNCVCHSAAATIWWHISEVNPAINMATDTQEARNASYWWMWMGAISTVFMVVVCYTGWWYQRLVRRRFEYAVEELYIPPRIEGLTAGRPSNDRPDYPFGSHEDTEPLLGRDETLQGLDPVRLSSKGRGGVWSMLGNHGNSSSVSLPLIRVSLDEDREESEREGFRMSPLQSPKMT